MANDFDSILKTTYKHVYEKAADVRPSFMDLTDPIIEQSPTYQEGMQFGVTEFVATSDNPTPINLDSVNSSTSMADFETVIKVSMADRNNFPTMLANAGMQVIQLGWQTVGNAFWTAIENTPSTLHGASGDALLNSGSAAYFADSFTVDPPNASSFTQANLVTTAFSDAALTAGLAAHNVYRNFSGNPYQTQTDAPILFYKPALETAVRNTIVHRNEFKPLGGTGGAEANVFDGRVRGLKKIPGIGGLSTSNKWGLWWNRQVMMDDGSTMNCGPIVPWVRTAPQVRFEVSPSSNHVYVVGFLEYAIHYTLNEGDLYYANVA